MLAFTGLDSWWLWLWPPRLTGFGDISSSDLKREKKKKKNLVTPKLLLLQAAGFGHIVWRSFFAAAPRETKKERNCIMWYAYGYWFLRPLQCVYNSPRC